MKEDTDPGTARRKGTTGRTRKSFYIDDVVWKMVENTAGHLGINYSHTVTEGLREGLPIIKKNWCDDAERTD